MSLDGWLARQEAHSAKALAGAISARALRHHRPGFGVGVVPAAGSVLASPVGALWDPVEGHLDPSGTTHAYAKAAKKLGAEIVLRNRVIELTQEADGTWNVVTEQGTVKADHVVNAGGLWAREVGRMVGLELPLLAMEHMYLLTESMPEVREFNEASGRELVGVIDFKGEIYTRQEREGLLLGTYEKACVPWSAKETPWDFGHELLQPDLDRISPSLEIGFEHFPAFGRAGIKQTINGPFTFAPDGNPLVGPVQGLTNFWCACAVMAGFSQGGGVGLALANWMTEGDPGHDIFGMDVARYGDFAENKEFIRQTTGQFYTRRFVMTYPNEQLPAGRPLKMAPAYADMTAAGARWGASWGLELPLYFAPSEDFEEKPTLKRSNAFPIVAEECKAVRETAGLLDITGFSRFEITGDGAEAWLDHLLASKLPAPGRAKLAPMLAPDGRLKGDLTVFNWGDGTWWIMGSYYLREWHMRWFHDHMGDGISVRDISDATVGFGVSGPNARKIIEKLTDGPIADLPFMGCGTFDIGLYRCKVGRLSVAGELGYEIHCSAAEHIGLRKLLLQSGADLGLREVGFNALLSLRLEKSFGIWSAEFTQGYTPAQTGMDRWIAWDKGDFIGKAAAQSERDAGGPSTHIVTLEIDADDADASGFEPVWQNGQRVGFVTSGGYGHTTGKSLAMAMLDRTAATEGTELTVHIVGAERPAKVIAPSPYDPSGKAMRT